LSRFNRVKPVQMISLLGAMYRGPEYDSYEDSFPIPGQDGAMRKRMKTLKTRGNIHAKTGYIKGVTCLSGYITSQDTETFAFTVLVNNPQGDVKEVMDKACTIVSKFSRDPQQKPAEPTTPTPKATKTPKVESTPKSRKATSVGN
ncbi:TPA: hypothetical protein DDW35_06425, partial [Candidatus Sumerlaeota bacterium]|nr:hypothetical protein [Candidatus Sumerlaeota bacterium]